jgi:hypothetical protein
MPKVSLYGFAQTQLKKFGIIISNEKLKDNGFSFEIKDGMLSVEKIPSANISKVEIKTFIFYNSVNIKGIILAQAVKSFAPVYIENINIHYSFINPLNIIAKAKGDFGEAQATFNLIERKLHIDLVPSKMMQKSYRSTLRNLQKTKDGGYIYEQTI